MRVNKCPMCNKDFIMPAKNIYKTLIKGKVTHYCSYNCYRMATKDK